MRAALGSFLKSIFAFFVLAFQKMLVIITIFFAAIITVGLFSILGFSFYLRRRNRFFASENQKQLDEIPVYRSLFEPNEAEIRAFEIEQQSDQRKKLQQQVLDKAQVNDLQALLEAQSFEFDFYNEVLSQLARKAATDREFLLLCAFLKENNLRTSAEIIERFREVWQKSFDKKDTIELLHFSAKTESAEIFSETLETVIQHWRNNFLSQINLKNLLHLAESEFWLLPTEAKTSGAGFLLKQKLANLREEVRKSDSLIH